MDAKEKLHMIAQAPSSLLAFLCLLLLHRIHPKHSVFQLPTKKFISRSLRETPGDDLFDIPLTGNCDVKLQHFPDSVQRRREVSVRAV